MTTTTTFEPDVYDWSPVSAEVGRFVRDLTSRYWIAARIEPGAGRGAPACWVPTENELEVDATFILDEIDALDGEPLDMHSTDGRAKTPRLVGAVAHEISHVLHSVGFPNTSTPRLVFEVWTALEESRCEQNFLKGNSRFRTFIRTAIDDIVRPTMMTNPDAMGAFAYAQVAALMLARVDSGLFSRDAFTDLESKIRERLTDDIYDALREVWKEFHATLDGDILSQVELAERWVEILKPLLDEEKDEIRQKIEEMMGSPMPGSGSSHSPHPGTSDDESSRESGAGFGDLAEAIRDASLSEALDAEDELADETREAAEREAEEIARSVASGAKRHAKTFSRGEQGQPAPAGVPGALRITRTEPSNEVRAGANRLAKMMERASFRDREVTHVTSVLPPGRLNGRARMEKRIAHKRGVPSNAEPWRTTRRKHVDSPTISMGIMLDVSGSMRRIAKSAQELGWAFAHAGYRIQATTAMVAFGDGVTPLVYPYERPHDIPTVEVYGSGEVFEHGFHALNSQLNLFPGRGPRLLVIVSDGHYVWTKHEAFNRQIMPRLVADGVHVLRVSPGRFTDAPDLPKQVEKVQTSGSFEEMITVAGRAAVKLLERG